VVGVKVRRCVAAFIPVHVNRNSSEVADPRHAPMLAPSHFGSAFGTFRTSLPGLTAGRVLS
jgi:hypothetical protein